MARTTNRLTDRRVKALKKPGRHADGGNLYLSISKTATGLSKRWTGLFSLHGKKLYPGFGSASSVPLAEAREKCAEFGSLVKKGVNPLDAAKAASDARAAAVEAEKLRRTFGQCATAFYAAKEKGWRSVKHRNQWERSIAEHCKPILDMPVDEVDTPAVLSGLTPIWGAVPAAAAMVRGRMEAILSYAKARGLRSGENPAAWRGHLDMILPKRLKGSKTHHPALAYRDVPAFIATLRESTSPYAPVLEFVILTACRSNEVLGGRLDEIDLAAKVWTIPASRMMAGVEHRVPLSGRAVEILEKQATIRRNEFVFPGRFSATPLSASALRLMAPSGATVHGFRSSFRDWAGNETSYPREVAEAALAHASGDQTEQAYRRSDALEKRRAMMEAWASFCAGAANVIHIKTAHI